MTPNIDFIGTVESNNESAKYVTYPIDVPRQFFVLLMAMARDDSKSVLHMQDEFEKRYPDVDDVLIDAGFLAPQPLDDRYVAPAKVPKRLTKKEYLEGAREIEARLRQEHETEVKRGSALQLPVEVRKELRLRQYRRSLKWRFVSQFVRFQAAYGYALTLEKYRIKERLNREVRMFSTDTIGWTTYNYVINHDVNVKIDSNFGYGHSSYFYLSLTYKGIELYPFCAYVRYPYANMRMLIGHTRSYRLERASWSDALEFVVETANTVIRAPQTVVETFILGEIKSMMDGLRDILQAKNLISEAITGSDEKRPLFLGVEVKGCREFRYEATLDEMLLALKAERIIGALAMLTRLKTIDAIVVSVGDSIRELIRMVNGLVPELERGIKKVKDGLHGCDNELGFLNSILLCVQSTVAKHEDALQRLRESALSKLESDAPRWKRNMALSKLKSEYERQNPSYRQVQSIKDKICKALASMQNYIDGRRLFLDVLQKCHGVGNRGERFWVVVEKLYPHEIEIDTEVKNRIEGMAKTNSIWGIDGIRNSVRDEYCSRHSEVANLFKERDDILDVIDTFPHSCVENKTK